jgi:hypothetical protein
LGEVADEADVDRLCAEEGAIPVAGPSCGRQGVSVGCDEPVAGGDFESAVEVGRDDGFGCVGGVAGVVEDDDVPAAVVAGLAGVDEGGPGLDGLGGRCAADQAKQD